MTSREEVVSTVKGVLNTMQPRIPYQPGFMGDSDAASAVVNTNRENYYWVRYPYANSTAVPTLCVAANVPKVAGFKVKVGRLPWIPDKDQVLGPSDERLDGVNPVEGSIVYAGNTAGYAITDGSSVNSGFLGLDPIYIDFSQVTPLSIQPSTGLNIQIMPGNLPVAGNPDVAIASQIIDLSASVPVSGARYTLISLDPTGAVVLTDGTINAGGFAALTNADIPATPAGNFRLGAVVLYAGQTDIVRTRTENDFIDLRYPQQSLAGNVSPSDILLTDTHIIVGDATGHGADVAMGNDATLADTGALTLKNTGPGATGPIGTATIIPVITVDAQGRVTALTSIAITFPAPGAGQIIGIARWAASAAQTNFDLPDTAEQLNIASDNGSIVDPTTYSLGTSNTQLIFDSGITAGHIVTAEYVIAQV